MPFLSFQELNLYTIKNIIYGKSYSICGLYNQTNKIPIIYFSSGSMVAAFDDNNNFINKRFLSSDPDLPIDKMLLNLPLYSLFL